MEEALKKKIEFLKKVGTGVVADAMLLLGIDGFTTHVFPISKDAMIAGPAFTTLSVVPVNGKEKPLNAYAVMDLCQPGDVIVRAGTPEGRLFGSNMASMARNKGVEGVVLDGKSRDLNEVENIIPLFLRCPTVRPSATTSVLVETQVPVVFDGVHVNPGDIVMGDRDGVLFIPAERLDDVIYQAEMIAEVEKEVSAALNEKLPVPEVVKIIKKKSTLRQ
jgi:regulator of RNase E activity RraA